LTLIETIVASSSIPGLYFESAKFPLGILNTLLNRRAALLDVTDFLLKRFSQIVYGSLKFSDVVIFDWTYELKVGVRVAVHVQASLL
jgi:hypothetical protein